MGHIGWNCCSFREVKKVKGEEKTQEQIINELRRRVAELEKSETQCERDVEKLPATDNEPRTMIDNLPENCNESYAHDLKTKAEEIKAYLEFFFYEAK
jgi:peptidoglycan hydrolase CwlO-like protein